MPSFASHPVQKHLVLLIKRPSSEARLRLLTGRRFLGSAVVSNTNARTFPFVFRVFVLIEVLGVQLRAVNVRMGLQHRRLVQTTLESELEHPTILSYGVRIHWRY